MAGQAGVNLSPQLVFCFGPGTVFTPRAPARNDPLLERVLGAFRQSKSEAKDQLRLPSLLFNQFRFPNGGQDENDQGGEVCA